jgi:NAD(P)-dependent dehydrogenase (short-subunit alcohol dehydrogenase family)
MSRQVFAGKVALVTGAARGIGRATVEAFAREGGAVAVLDQHSAEAAAVAEGIVAAGGRAIALTADVTDGAAMVLAAAACEEAFGSLDILVNNAGIHFARAIDEYTEEEFDRILSVNIKGAFHAIRAALPGLRKSRGSIVSVSSMTGLVGQDRGSGYVATKGAVISMTKALAIELAPDGIRVNCVCPAGVDTPLMRGWANTLPDPEGVLRAQGAMHLINRMATGEEIAAGILFLASPGASFITGTILPIEGGATLGYRRV